MHHPSALRTSKRALIVISLTALLMATAACAAPTANPAADDVETPGSESESTVACAELTADQLKTLGDAVPGEMTSDSYGDYCKLRINPDAEALIYDSSKVDFEALEEFGFTEEDAAQAQIAAVTYLVEQTMDSTVLDSSDLDVSQWESENSELFIDGGIPTSEGGATGEDFNLVTKYMPQPLDRSGQPRARSIDIQVNNTAFASEVDGSPWIMVQTGATATYGASDTKLVETMLANDPSRTEAGIEAEAPYLFDGMDASQVLVTGNFNFGYGANDLTRLVGAGAGWEIRTGEGTDL